MLSTWTSGRIHARTYGFDLDFAIKRLDSGKLFLTLIDLLAFFPCFLAIPAPDFQLCTEATKPWLIDMVIVEPIGSKACLVGLYDGEVAYRRFAE